MIMEFLKDVKIAGPLKYLSNFWRSMEMPLINRKIHLELNWSNDCERPLLLIQLLK